MAGTRLGRRPRCCDENSRYRALPVKRPCDRFWLLLSDGTTPSLQKGGRPTHR